jgi:hypothetical protein
VIQRGRCPLGDAMQKLGRANRSRTTVRYTGPRWSDLDGVEQERLLKRKRKPRASSRFWAVCQTHQLLQQFSGGRSLSCGRMHIMHPPNCGGRRSEVLSDDKLYSPGDRCLWEIMLEFFDQKLMDSNGQLMIKCENCNNCCPDGFRLSELRPSVKTMSEQRLKRANKKSGLPLNSWLCGSQNNQFSPTVP